MDPRGDGRRRRWLDRRHALSDFGMVPGRAWWREFAAGLLLGLSVPALSFAATVALGWGEVTGYLEWEGGTSPVVVGLLAALVAFTGIGYVEEVIFRGYLIRNAAEAFRGLRWTPRGAIAAATVTAALVFAFFHANDVTDALIAVHFVAAALFLSLPFLVTGRLGMPVGIHVTFNFGIMTVFNVEDTEARVISLATDGPARMVGEGGLIETGAIVVSAVLVLAWLRWRHGPLRLAPDLAEPPAISERV